MKKIEAVIRPSNLENIKEAFNKYNINGMTISQVLGAGMQKGETEYYRGARLNINLLPKIKLEVVVTDEQVDDVLEIITKENQTGQVGDGKIFIYNVEEVIRIRTGERGASAI